MIEIENLTKSFGPIAAVRGIDLTVARGEVLGLLGPNGAGKSTTMKIIAGFLAPSSGRVRICGHDVERDPLAAQRALGYLPEGAPAYGDMTPRQFLRFIAAARGLRGSDAKARVNAAAEKAELGPVLDRPIDTLSKGFKRRVGLAQAILHDPPVLVMDEPTDGLDPNQKHSVRLLIREMAAAKAILISTHLLEEVEAICTRAVIIDRGRIVADGTPAELIARSRYHNAVTFSLPSEQALAAQAVLEAHPSVAGVEHVSHVDGITTLTVLPRPEHTLVEEIGAAAVRERWQVKELYAEPGRLDEVFRSLTTSDSDRASAALRRNDTKSAALGAAA
jgi:ABC-2 type transport system ATP-binding protein